MYIVCGYFVSAEMCLMLTFIYSNADAITDENIRLQKTPDEQGALCIVCDYCRLLTWYGGIPTEA